MKLSCIDAIIPGETLKDKSENLEVMSLKGSTSGRVVKIWDNGKKKWQKLLPGATSKHSYLYTQIHFLCNCSLHFTKNEEHYGRQA
jgi:hypothetical protein